MALLNFLIIKIGRPVVGYINTSKEISNDCKIEMLSHIKVSLIIYSNVKCWNIKS